MRHALRTMRAFETANFFMDDTFFEMSKVKPGPMCAEHSPTSGLHFKLFNSFLISSESQCRINV